MNWLNSEMNIGTIEQIYSLKREDIDSKDVGPSLLNYASNSFLKLMDLVYPEYSIHPWLFDKVFRTII